MRCIICDGWSEATADCYFCDSAVCEECVVDGDSGEVFCSEECQTDYSVN